MAHRFFPRKTRWTLIFLTVLGSLTLARCGVKIPPRAAGYQDGPLSDLEPTENPEDKDKAPQ